MKILTLEEPEKIATVDFLSAGIVVKLELTQDGDLNVTATKEDRKDPASYFQEKEHFFTFDP